MEPRSTEISQLNLGTITSDILAEIFSFLPWGSNIARVSRVCKRFHLISKTRWQPEFLELDTTPLLVKQGWLPLLRRNAAHLKHLSLVCKYPSSPSPAPLRIELFKNVDLLFPHLEILELPFAPGALYSENVLDPIAEVKAFTKRAPKLRLVIVYFAWYMHFSFSEQFANEAGETVTFYRLDQQRCSTTHPIQTMDIFRSRKLSLNRPFPVNQNLLGHIFGASCTMEMVKYAIANGLDLLQPFRPRYLPTDNLFHSILLASQSIEVVTYALDHLEKTNRRLVEPPSDATTWKMWADMSSPTYAIDISCISYIAACKWFYTSYSTATVLQRLVALGARTHIWGIYGDTLLHTFNRSNINTDFFRELIRLGAHVNPKRTDPEGYGKYRVPDSKRAPWVQYLDPCKIRSELLMYELYLLILPLRHKIEHCALEDVLLRNEAGLPPVQLAIAHCPFSIPLLARKGAPLTPNEKGETVLDQWLLLGPLGHWIPFPSKDNIILIKFFHEAGVGCTLVKSRKLHQLIASAPARSMETVGEPSPLQLLHALVPVLGNADWVNECDAKGTSLLEHVCAKAYSQCVIFLLKLGAEFQSKLQKCIDLAEAAGANVGAAGRAFEIKKILLRLDSDRKMKANHDAEVAGGRKPEKALDECCMFCLRCRADIVLHVKKRHLKALKILHMKPEEGVSSGIADPPTPLFVKALTSLCPYEKKQWAKK